MSSPRLLLLIGLPGSGKSTLAKMLLETQPGRILISTDAIRGQLFGNEAVQGPWRQVWAELQRQLQQAALQVSDGLAQEAIFDATNVVRRQRREAIALIRQCGFTHLTGLWLDVPLEVCLERNQKRDRQVPDAIIQRMHRCLTGAPPSLQERLDCLIHYRFF
ncbi:MAG: AAA family ATPase [Oculatellaceae cyanobacterium bins.114]|nr:AAA family ATPase [Oculatellaceae cyanobacterium bins.114]